MFSLLAVFLCFSDTFSWSDQLTQCFFLEFLKKSQKKTMTNAEKFMILFSRIPREIPEKRWQMRRNSRLDRWRNTKNMTFLPRIFQAWSLRDLSHHDCTVIWHYSVGPQGHWIRLAGTSWHSCWQLGQHVIHHQGTKQLNSFQRRQCCQRS